MAVYLPPLPALRHPIGYSCPHLISDVEWRRCQCRVPFRLAIFEADDVRWREWPTALAGVVWAAGGIGARHPLAPFMVGLVSAGLLHHWVRTSFHPALMLLSLYKHCRIMR